jgi:hypothetical protein
MPKEEDRMKRLLLYWGPEETADFQTPAEVKWEDGSPATIEDYRKHQLCTQSVQPSEKGLVTVICPDIVAVTRYDSAKGHWVLYTDRGTMDLDETDPNASDADLDAQLAT